MEKIRSNLRPALDVWLDSYIIRQDMFCPQCGSTQSDELNYCKTCGGNLAALRQIMASRDTDVQIDRTNNGLGEAMMTSDERRRRRGASPERRRRNEIKAGVIAASTGVSLSIVLAVIMEAIVINGGLGALAADIISRVWIVGLIPVMVGLALIFNGAVLSRKGERPTNENKADQLPPPNEAAFLSPADTTDLTPAEVSVTENTTEHLKVPG